MACGNNSIRNAENVLIRTRLATGRALISSTYAKMGHLPHLRSMGVSRGLDQQQGGPPRDRQEKLPAGNFQPQAGQVGRGSLSLGLPRIAPRSLEAAAGCPSYLRPLIGMSMAAANSRMTIAKKRLLIVAKNTG
jgi:hypothetical protein